MATATSEQTMGQTIIPPTEAELAALGEVTKLLARSAGRDLMLISQRGQGLDGKEMDRAVLPPTAVQLLRHLIELLARGTAVALVPASRPLRTQAAADLLGVSRPHLVTLLEQGEIAFTMTGNQRRVRLEDLLLYKARRDAQRRVHLDELVRMSEELALYND